MQCGLPGDTIVVNAIEGHAQMVADDNGGLTENELLLGMKERAGGLRYNQLFPNLQQGGHEWCGGPCCNARPISCNCALGRCIQDELVAALQQVHGGEGRVKVTCYRWPKSYSGCRIQFIWVVSW